VKIATQRYFEGEIVVTGAHHGICHLQGFFNVFLLSDADYHTA